MVDSYRDYKEVTREKFLKSRNLSVNITVEGALLLQGESQQFTIHFHEIVDGDAPKYSISVPYGSKNKVVNVVNTGSVDSPSLLAKFARQQVTHPEAARRSYVPCLCLCRSSIGEGGHTE